MGRGRSMGRVEAKLCNVSYYALTTKVDKSSDTTLHEIDNSLH